MRSVFSLVPGVSLLLAAALASPVSVCLGDVSSEATAVVAKVNESPIFAGDVQQQVDLVLRGRKAEPAALQQLQAQAIEQLIGRQLILEFLAEKKLAANDRELDLEIDRLRKRLEVTGGTLEDLLKKSHQDLAGLRRNLAWKIGWERYLERYLTEENLRKFYEKNPRPFDGTEVRVAHVLLKIDLPAEDAAVEAALAKGAQIREEIISGKLTFAEAAERYSQSPTAKSGGDIGFITRHESMPESFAAAAFELKPGEISPPVVSPFGVHLIRVVELKPGQKEWRIAKEEVRVAATRYLFDWIANQQRAKAKIEYTGALPHFKPGTRELAE